MLWDLQLHQQTCAQTTNTTHSGYRCIGMMWSHRRALCHVYVGTFHPHFHAAPGSCGSASHRCWLHWKAAGGRSACSSSRTWHSGWLCRTGPQCTSKWGCKSRMKLRSASTPTRTWGRCGNRPRWGPRGAGGRWSIARPCASGRPSPTNREIQTLITEGPVEFEK